MGFDRPHWPISWGRRRPQECQGIYTVFRVGNDFLRGRRRLRWSADSVRSLADRAMNALQHPAFIGLITPAPPKSQAGNRITAERWAKFLRRLGHRVAVKQSYDGQPYDL